MKFLVAAFCAAAVLAGGISASTSRSTTTYTDHGNLAGCANGTCFPAPGGVTVYIRNNTLGTPGSTVTDSNGNFSFGGMVAGYRYTESARLCKNNQLAFGYKDFTQGSGNQDISFVMSPNGSC